MKKGIVFHYTSIDALRCLIDSVSKSKHKDSFLFQASNILFMNDPNEFYYGRKILVRTLREIEDELGVLDEWRLSSLWSGNTLEEEKRKDIEYVQYLQNMKEIPFVLSFSLLEDSLPMWLNYGNHGKGVCLALQDNREQPYLYRDTVQGKLPYESFYTSDVFYDEIDKDSQLYKILYNTIKDYKDDIASNSLDNRDAYFDALLQTAVPFIKTMHYKSESEVRVSKTIRFHHYGEKNVAKFRCNKWGNLIPYIDEEININQLKYIIWGPLVDFNLTKLAIDMMIGNVLNKKIDILASNIQFREY